LVERSTKEKWARVPYLSKTEALKKLTIKSLKKNVLRANALLVSCLV
jgi:hypothetical protein